MAYADELVETDAEREALRALRDATAKTDEMMERHGVRCFLLSEKLAAKAGERLDREVILCASLVHDIGLYDAASEGGVYTEESAAVARRIGEEAGWDDRRTELCAEACARHHALRAQRGFPAEVECLRLADRIEVSGGFLRSGLSRAEIGEVFNAVPRDGVYRKLARDLWPVVRDRPRTLPRVFSP